MRGDIVNRAGDRLAMHLLEEKYLEPLKPELESIISGTAHRRMVRLGGRALAEASAGCPTPLPLLLALPEAPEGRVAPSLLAHLAIQAGIELDVGKSATYRQGGAGALYALADALALLSTGAVQQVLVGGVDTFLDLMRLGRLDAEGRTYGSRSRLGFLPGEGAAFLLLRGNGPGARGAPSPSGPPAMARVLGVGTGEEKGHRYSKEPYRGEGLADAFEALFQHIPSTQPKVRCVYAGFNGEEMPAKEWGVARLRNSERFAEEVQVEHPADCIGDSGAALGPIMLGLAAVAISQGYLPEPRPIWAEGDPGPCLVWCASDRAPRAAALLQR